MKELKKEDLQITELIHRFVREHVEAGDICIDATAGCGNDTLFLCELNRSQRRGYGIWIFSRRL